jgi:hypothetical protein
MWLPHLASEIKKNVPELSLYLGCTTGLFFTDNQQTLTELDNPGWAMTLSI